MTPTLPRLTGSPTRYPGCCMSLSEPLLTTIGSILASSAPAPEPGATAAATTTTGSSEPGERVASSSSSGPALLVLSVGSGTGLLEELLHIYLNAGDSSSSSSSSSLLLSSSSTPSSSPQRRAATWRVEGVEVDPAVNVHLPEDRMNHVPGTWAVLGTRARAAAALVFAYPRDGRLVRRYVDEAVSSSPPLVLWLGPKCDWEDTGLASFATGADFDVLEVRDGAGLAEYEMLAVLKQASTTSGWLELTTK